jgi:hypothetical protein
VEPHSRQYFRLADILETRVASLGETTTREDAEVAIDMLHAGDTALTVDEVLAENGYRLSRRVKDRTFYHRDYENGRFTILVTDLFVCLSFTAPESRSSKVLLVLNRSSSPHPAIVDQLFWPQQVEQNFHTLAVQAAMVVTDLFVAEGRDVQKPARSSRRNTQVGELKLAA